MVVVGKFANSAGRICAASALALGSMLLATNNARADFVTEQIIQNAIQNVLQNVRDQIQRRDTFRGDPRQGGRPGQVMRFSSEESPSQFDEAFAALGYSGLPTKGPRMVAPAPAVWLYGLNFSGSGDESRAAGVRTRSFTATGTVDVTKIGIFDTSDALTLMATGIGVFSRAPGMDSTTGVAAGTIAYSNGGFSADVTVNTSWTRASLAAVGIAAAGNSSAISFAPNVQYRFNFPHTVFIEPTVGFTYTETYTQDFGAKTGDSTEVHGGARVGFETMVHGVRVQPTFSGAAFSIANQTGAAGGVPVGQLGIRGSGKVNMVWSDKFSTFIEVHGSSIATTTSYGTSGGLRWSF